MAKIMKDGKYMGAVVQTGTRMARLTYKNKVRRAQFLPLQLEDGEYIECPTQKEYREIIALRPDIERIAVVED